MALATQGCTNGEDWGEQLRTNSRQLRKVETSGHETVQGDSEPSRRLETLCLDERSQPQDSSVTRELVPRHAQG